MSQSKHCYHCHEPIPDGFTLNVEVLNAPRSMCCLGCAAVAESIVDSGLSDYYRHRTDVALKIEGELIPDALKTQFSQLDIDDVQREFCTSEGAEREALLSIDGVKCGACAWLIETTLYKQVGVVKATVNASTHRLLLRWHNDTTQLSTLLSALARLGYQALPYDSEHEDQRYKHQKQNYLIRLGVAALASMQVMMFAVALYFGVVDMEPQHVAYMRWVSLLMATPVIIYSALPFYQNALIALRSGQLNMDVPVSLALVVAYVASAWATLYETGEVYFESISMFVFFLLLGRYFELMARYKANAKSANAVKLLPAVVHRRVDGRLETVPVKSITVGDTLLLKPGETMAVDAIVLSGDSHVDLSVLTGEHLPIRMATGETIYAGAINLDQPLEIQVTEIKETLVASIVRLQEQALAERSASVSFADSIARYFVLALLIIAVSTALFWWFQSPDDALWITLAVLVATCPCALSLATPTAMTVGLSRLSEIGVIARRADLLNELAKVDTVVFDKTGTLTHGKTTVSDVTYYSQIEHAKVIAIAKALEQASTHPLAHAINQLDSEQNWQSCATDIQHVEGLGIYGTIDGSKFVIGGAAWVETMCHVSCDTQHRVVLAQQGQVIAGFDFKDSLRGDAPQAIEQVKMLSLTPVLLSGDQQRHVDALAHTLSIETALGDRTPQTKLDWVRESQRLHKKVLMIGDGINDGPVLSQANASLAIADGTDIAKRSADGVLVNPKLVSISKAIQISKSTQSIIKQNLAWALGYNVLVLPLAVSGLLPPYIAVIGMSSSSLIVVVNALRVGRKTVATQS
ncbi:heavy metal translocating P-type ATPase [Echinimonas agarilytica]|uniref:Cadmium-translocating P-type ATPase n=1 Tax=Echinimonas agarilytica TaxID=1215918 RepID=A0AA42B8M0_9GAMM|nr:heavy metal translocating P-type ATPase [Echinimonas agarilytica]MCM2681190.1 cadmium-translocating P-type ATPase [Echinimonas agarilytica]